MNEDRVARRMMLRHNQQLSLYIMIPHKMPGGFVIAYPDVDTVEILPKDTRVFPADSYALPILKVKTTSRDVREWIDGKATGKHANWDLRA